MSGPVEGTKEKIWTLVKKRCCLLLLFEQGQRPGPPWQKAQIEQLRNL